MNPSTSSDSDSESSNSSADRLCQDFANLQVDNNSVQRPSGFPLAKRISIPARGPYSESIWAVDSFCNGGYGYNFKPGGTSSSSSSSSINNFPSTSCSFSEPPLILTSSLRSNKVLDMGVHEILLMAKDEEGSKFLQEGLSFPVYSRIVSRVFEMALEFTLELMTSKHGRFVFGKLIESCDEDHLRAITFKIVSEVDLFLNASIDINGSSCIKKLIRVLGRSKTNFLAQIMSTLGRFFGYLMVNRTGSSIILLSLDNCYIRNNDFVYQAALEHCLSLANHEQGCISMNNFIDEMKGSRRKQILQLISMNAVCLAKNPFGNYVLKHVLDLEDPALIEKICLMLRGHVINLSMMKGGSHVVEKCLKFQEFMYYAVEEFLGSNRTVEVANHSCGNYVMQTALRETRRVDRGLHDRLVMKLRENLTELLQFGHGRHVYKLICS
ncbi:pumilio homolog 12-like [Mangifera indica]|uniref:pumilio homolog 12-like n=1 Tax=Mangifera indica TaxID=29780 RepID=UPI001CFAC1D3|nr:pumilio homolog 12-like [Mangifera indica]